MGRDKSHLRVGGRTMLANVRLAARSAGLPVRVIRRDIIPRCGPIGGIFTGLKSSRAAVVVVLPCDMPFLVSAPIRSVISALRARDKAVFTSVGGLAGFPCVLRRHVALPIVEAQIAGLRNSIQSLAKALHARLICPSRRWISRLENINTRSELQIARDRLKKTGGQSQPRGKPA